MRFIGLLMVAGVIGFSHSAEGQDQNLDGGQGVIWVEGELTLMCQKMRFVFV